MDKTKEALYGLIRMALIGERPMAFPESVDWNLLYDYAKMQGVAAIAMDGLQTLMNNIGFAPVGLGIKTKLQWYALAMSIEKGIPSSWSQAKRLRLFGTGLVYEL